MSQQSAALRLCTPRVTAIAVAVGAVFAASALYARRRANCMKDDIEDDNFFDGVSASPLVDASAPSHHGGVEKPTTHPDASVATEREEALRLTRRLLREIPGSEFLDSTDGAASDVTSATNVSLNYHIAKELEREARDSLIELVANGQLAHATIGPDTRLADYEPVLCCALDYLDISVERERLRARRTVKACGEDLLCGNGPAKQQMQMQMQMQQRRAMDATYEGLFAHASEMDERLRAPHPHDMEERFEMGWDEGDEEENDNEADLMAYLDQSDTAGYGNRMEARLAAMMRNNMHLLDADDEMSFDGAMDGDGFEDDGDEEEEEDEEEEMLAKLEFERMLLHKLKQLAMLAGVESQSKVEPRFQARPQNLVPAPSADADAGDKEGEWETDDEGEEV